MSKTTIQDIFLQFYPKYLEKSMRKLIREQRKLSRKQIGSNNRNKQRVKVALVHEKITNQRNDFLQKQSTMLIRENQTICIEELKIKNMMRNHKLAQHIHRHIAKLRDVLTANGHRQRLFLQTLAVTAVEVRAVAHNKLSNNLFMIKMF